jgi:hypothetical protein
VANVETKTIEVVGPRSALTPCILDDDPEQLSLLSKMISEMGYESLLTDDPEEAVRLVQSGTYREFPRTFICLEYMLTNFWIACCAWIPGFT